MKVADVEKEQKEQDFGLAELLERVVVVVVENIDDMYIEHEYVQFGDCYAWPRQGRAQTRKLVGGGQSGF